MECPSTARRAGKARHEKLSPSRIEAVAGQRASEQAKVVAALPLHE